MHEVPNRFIDQGDIEVMARLDIVTVNHAQDGRCSVPKTILILREKCLV